MSKDFKIASVTQQGEQKVFLGIDESNETPFRFQSLNVGKIYNVKLYGAKGDGVTDDTSAIQNAILAAHAAGGGKVYFPKGVYIVSGPLQTSVGGQNPNCQIYIPVISQANYSDRVPIEIEGESQPDFLVGSGVDRPNDYMSTDTAVVIRSTIQGSGVEPAVFGTKGSNLDLNNYNSNQCSFKNLWIQVTPNGSNKITMGGINFGLAHNVIVEKISAGPYNIALTDIAEPDVVECSGIIMPKRYGYTVVPCRDVVVAGFTNGIVTGGHTVLDNVFSFCCVNGFNFRETAHMVTALRITGHWNKYDLYFSEPNSYVNIHQLDCEYRSDGSWFDTVYAVHDPNNYGFGKVDVHVVESGVGFNNNSQLLINGAANLRIMKTCFTDNSSYTVTGSTDTDKLNSLISKLEDLGIIIDGTT